MASPSKFQIPKLPPGISIERAYTDMMRYLMGNTQKYFESTTPNGAETWARVRDEMIIIFATPNGWDLHQHGILRGAAVKAGIATQENAERLVRFMTEAEAAVHYALMHYSAAWLQDNTIFAVVDAGGSTVDTTVYQCTLTSPLRLQEVSASQCIQVRCTFRRLYSSRYHVNISIRQVEFSSIAGSRSYCQPA